MAIDGEGRARIDGRTGRSALSRRGFLRLGGDLALLAALPAEVLAASLDVTWTGVGAGRFLSADELATLRALCARLVPGPPEEPDPGALEAGVPEYVDLLLGAFEGARPPIFAGGPFSHRDGGGANAFADFLELDAIEERVWRTHIEGSRGLPEREWNDPVIGLQEHYRAGLATLDEAAARLFGARFAALAPWRADLLLRTVLGEVRTFLDLAFRHAIEGMYGAPEYGGNRGGVGWSYTRWPGDHQPHAYTAREIGEPDADQREAVARSAANARGATGDTSDDG